MLKKLWSWKFRIIALLLFVSAFTGGYGDGFLSAVFNLLIVYSIFCLGKFVVYEQKATGDK
jgi:hypothetical protein